MSENIRRRYNEYVQRSAPGDFWAQVRRTVDGAPLAPEQLDMIVNAVVGALQIETEDLLLDLCCGNGALTDRIFERCRGGLGIDFSDALIAVAKQSFERAPDRLYELGDVVQFAAAGRGGRFTKALCYGSFPHLPFAGAEALLADLRANFQTIRRFFIGNLPDKARMHEFYYRDAYTEGLEDDNESSIGIWRTADEFVDLARRTGWRAAISRMPNSFYASHYRYDATLTPL